MEVPPSPSSSSGAPQPPTQDRKAYWKFWTVLFGTVVTWVFTVIAAVDNAAVSSAVVSVFCDSTTIDDDEVNEICDLSDATTAFQYTAAILISFVLVLVVVAAFTRAPDTGKLALAVGVMLAMFSVFQLVAFAVVASFSAKVDEFASGVYSYHAARTLAFAMVASLLGAFGATVTLILRRRATIDQDGPLRVCKVGRGGNGAPSPAENSRAVGTAV
ncbi:unnamed protein product [Scytosiphon promiscuus]